MKVRLANDHFNLCDHIVLDGMKPEERFEDYDDKYEYKQTFYVFCNECEERFKITLFVN